MKLIALLLLPLLAFTTADTWQPFAISPQLTVQLPIAPTEIDLVKHGLADAFPPGVRVFLARVDGNVYELVGPLQMPQTLNLQDAKEQKDFYDGVVMGLVEQQGNTLLRRTPFKSQDVAGTDVTYRTHPTATSKASTMFSRCFVVDHASYTLTFFSTSEDTTVSAAPRRRFFNSITVKS